jgi:hypothetical protein
MSKRINLRGGEKIVPVNTSLPEIEIGSDISDIIFNINDEEEEVVVVNEVAENPIMTSMDPISSTPTTPVNPVDSLNTSILSPSILSSVELLCEKVGRSLQAEISCVIADLKTYLATELSKSDLRITSLESELVSLKDALSESYVKINRLESNLNDFRASLEKNATSSTQAPILPPAETFDTVIAGDSIMKHLKVDELEGSNKLICLPGARSHKVYQAVRQLARSAAINKLVLHFGTNHIPQDPHQSPAAVAKEISDTLMRLKGDLPDTNIYFSALLPKFDGSYNHGIDFINRTICGLCHEHDMGFIKHSAFCHQGQFNRGLYAPSEWRQGRPLHPSHEGALSLLTDIKLGII